MRKRFGKNFQYWLCSFGTLRDAARELNKRGISVTYEAIRAWRSGISGPKDRVRLQILLEFPESGLTLLDFMERLPEAHELWEQQA